MIMHGEDKLVQSIDVFSNGHSRIFVHESYKKYYSSIIIIYK